MEMGGIEGAWAITRKASEPIVPLRVEFENHGDWGNFAQLWWSASRSMVVLAEMMSGTIRMRGTKLAGNSTFTAKGSQRKGNPGAESCWLDNFHVCCENVRPRKHLEFGACSSDG